MKKKLVKKKVGSLSEKVRNDEITKTRNKKISAISSAYWVSINPKALPHFNYITKNSFENSEAIILGCKLSHHKI